jgi:hypothetical protein
MRIVRLLIVAALAAASALALPPAPAQAAICCSSITVLDVPPGEHQVEANAINNRNEVAGTLDRFPVIWDAVTGHRRDLAVPPGAIDVAVADINSAGVAVGTALINGRFVPIRWNTGGSVTQFAPVVGDTDMAGYRIGDDGSIAGGSWHSGQSGHTPAWARDGAPAALVSTDEGWVSALSGNGVLTGEFRGKQCGCTYGYATDGTKVLPLPAPAGSYATPGAISANGETIAGYTDYFGVSIWKAHRSASTHQRFYVRTTIGSPDLHVPATPRAMTTDGSAILGQSTRPWIYRDGRFTLFGQTSTDDAWDMNDSGAVLGRTGTTQVVWHLNL